MLRRVLTLAGTRCRFTTQITAVGLYLPEEVEALISRFEAGEIAFTSINDIIFESAPTAHSRMRGKWFKSRVGALLPVDTILPLSSDRVATFEMLSLATSYFCDRNTADILLARYDWPT